MFIVHTEMSIELSNMQTLWFKIFSVEMKITKSTSRESISAAFFLSFGRWNKLDILSACEPTNSLKSNDYNSQQGIYHSLLPCVDHIIDLVAALWTQNRYAGNIGRWFFSLLRTGMLPLKVTRYQMLYPYYILAKVASLCMATGVLRC